MEVFFIFMVSAGTCVSYQYNYHETYYRPRHGFNRISSLPTLYGRTPFGTFRKRFQPRLYRENYYRDRSVYPSPSAWLRKKKKGPVAPTVLPKNVNSSLGVYGAINNVQVNATLVKDDTYPWIALVVHTPDDISAVLCTAACIEERIFVTAARCIYKAKTCYTRVHYQDELLQPLAFVLPSKPTKQMFYDVGLIVVNKKFTKTWKSIEIASNHLTWADDDFMWHAKLPWYEGVAVGYVSETYDLLPNAKNNVALYEVQVSISSYLCYHLCNVGEPIDQYFLPCYSPCNLTEHLLYLPKCWIFLAGEGHMVIEHTKGKLLGVATWAGSVTNYALKDATRLPVGMVVLNSPVFKEDLGCAQKIKAAPDTSGRFDTFCN